MRKHVISLGIVALVVAGAVWFVVETPAHPPPAPPRPAPSRAAAPPSPGAKAADPAVPHTVAEGRAALARLTPAERAELAPLAKAFEAAARAAAAPPPPPTPPPRRRVPGPRARPTGASRWAPRASRTR